MGSTPLSRPSTPHATVGPVLANADLGARFYIVVVLYEMALDDSPTIASLAAAASTLGDATILLWDNGPVPQESAQVERFVARSGWAVEYVHTPENVGLAKIYTDAIQRSDDHDLIVLWDQDSVFATDYFDQVRRAAAAHPTCALFLPIVESHDRIVSPGSYRWIKGRYWSTPRTGLVPATGLTAINSGMAVRHGYLVEEFVGYDLRFRFYGIDTFFMLDHARRRPFAFVLTSVVQHASALLDTDAPKRDRLRRHAGLFEAWILLHEASLVRSVLVRLYVLYVGARETARSRDARFATVAAAAAFGRRPPRPEPT